MDVASSRFPAKRSRPAADASHTAMRVNLDACIHCNLCVRACREVQVNDVIGYAFRGEHSKIVFDFDDAMAASSCVACGECVQACPTGALTPATMVDADQVGDSKAYDREVQSVCPYCGVGCQLSFKIKNDRIVSVDLHTAGHSHECVPSTNMHYIADAALHLMTSQPELGIKNPYQLNKAQFDAAVKLLEDGTAYRIGKCCKDEVEPYFRQAQSIASPR